MISTTQIKHLNWDQVQANIHGLRYQCLIALLTFGPGTTRQIAVWTGIPLLTVRPRVTELLHLRIIEISGRSGRDGIYRARDYATVHAEWTAQPQSPLQ